MSLDATRWAWRQEGLRPAEKLILLSIADRAGETHEAHPSITRLSADTGLNRKTIMRAIGTLETRGILQPQKVRGATSEYRLIGVVGRHETSTKNGTCKTAPTSTKTGTSQVPKTGH
jgi:pyocin large subunit-like protein